MCDLCNLFVSPLCGKRHVELHSNAKKRQARSALSALESFAMEREDAVAKLSHEKEELLEELKGARSGQDRSAEEVGWLAGRQEKTRNFGYVSWLVFWLVW